MKIISKTGRLWHGLTALFSCLLVVSLGLANVGNMLEARINFMLGTTSTKIVTLDSAEAADTTYFASDFSTPEELIAYRENLNREIVTEGAVLLKNNGALPLGSGVNVTMFGIGGVSPIYRGSSGGGVIKNPAQIVPLTDAFAQAGITTNPTVHDWYVSTGIPETCMIPVTGRDGTTTINGP